MHTNQVKYRIMYRAKNTNTNLLIDTNYYSYI